MGGYEQTLFSPTSSAISMFAPSAPSQSATIHELANDQYIPTVPSNKPPFKQNFMFEVPDASVPAVEMC